MSKLLTLLTLLIYKVGVVTVLMIMLWSLGPNQTHLVLGRDLHKIIIKLQVTTKPT